VYPAKQKQPILLVVPALENAFPGQILQVELKTAAMSVEYEPAGQSKHAVAL